MDTRDLEIPQGILFKDILESVSDAVTLIDRDLKIRYQNKTIRKVFGTRIGEHCYKAYRNLEAPCGDCMILEVFRDGRDRRGVRDVPLPGGGVSLLEISSAAVRNAEGEIIGAAEVARDVTHQKKVETLLNKTLLERNEVLQQLNSELSDAAGYVKAVLPSKIRSGPLQTDWRFIPSKSLGGDSFGYHWLDDDHFAFYLVDVSGHGWAAALLSVSIMNVLRSQALPDTDFRRPEQVLFALNNTFPSERNNNMFFTIWYGLFCRSSQEIVYASGGHPPALLFFDAAAGHARAQQLRTPNLIIGGLPDTHYQSASLQMRIPGSLLIFSDGVYDITKSDGTLWGYSAFEVFLKQTPRSDRSTCDLLLNKVRALSNSDTFEDDFSVMEIHFLA